MGTLPECLPTPSNGPVRILMICPLCGHENVEAATSLRLSAYSCHGEGCDYRFDLTGGQRKSLADGFSTMWRKFYAALTPAD